MWGRAVNDSVKKFLQVCFEMERPLSLSPPEGSLALMLSSSNSP